MNLEWQLWGFRRFAQAIKVKHIDVYTDEGKATQQDSYRVTRMKKKELVQVCTRWTMR
ncbi:MAG: hypothetical protein IPG93_10180 [Burkholderiales bacterium]|nr:hypothetical protein [Burkholderiales bacterium]